MDIEMLKLLRRLAESSITSEIEELRELTSLISNLLTEEVKKFSSRIDKTAQELSYEEREKYYEWHSDDHWRLSKAFPNITAASLFVTNYSFLEFQLLLTCNSLQSTQDFPIKLSDLRGEGIFLAKNYLKKVVGLSDFPDQTAQWNEICQYNRIRNFIIHNNSRLNDSEGANAIKLYIKNKPSITLDTLDRFQIPIEFIIEEIDTIEIFFQDFLKSLDNWLKRLELVRP
jgi:hypothetical protein